MTVKLFGHHTQTIPELDTDSLPIGAANLSEPIADADKLVLEIEGDEEAVEDGPVQPLKADTNSLPNQDDLLLKTLNAALADTNDDDEKPAPVLKRVSKASAAADAEPAAYTEPEPESPHPASSYRADAPSADVKPPLTSVSYASMAKAVEDAKKEPTGRFARDAVDDETLLDELYTLIGDTRQQEKSQTVSDSLKPEARPVRPAVRIRPEDLQMLPEEDVDEIEEDVTGVPGWLKGVFILLLSLLLSAMTFYAVASDVIGEIF